MHNAQRAERDHPSGTLLELSRVCHGKDANAIDVTSVVHALHAHRHQPTQTTHALDRAARRFMAACGRGCRRGCTFRALERAIAELLRTRPTAADTTTTLALAVRYIEGPTANGVVPGERIVVAPEEEEEEEPEVTTIAECQRVAGRGLYTLVDVNRPGTMLATFTGEAVAVENDDDDTYYVTAGETAACPKYGLPRGGGGGGDANNNAKNGKFFMCANEPNPGEFPNAAIVEVAVREDIAVFGIMATAPIGKGQEVTVDYGSCDEWPHRNSRKRKRNADAEEEVDVCYDGEWYRAKITARVVSGETFTVQYKKDGMHESQVIPERIRKLEVA